MVEFELSSPAWDELRLGRSARRPDWLAAAPCRSLTLARLTLAPQEMGDRVFSSKSLCAAPHVRQKT